MRKSIAILLATIILHVPDEVVEEVSRWFHQPENSTETKAEYSTKRVIEFGVPIASFGRFKTPEEAGIMWEVKDG